MFELFDPEAIVEMEITSGDDIFTIGLKSLDWAARQKVLYELADVLEELQRRGKANQEREAMHPTNRDALTTPPPDDSPLIARMQESMADAVAWLPLVPGGTKPSTAQDRGVILKTIRRFKHLKDVFILANAILQHLDPRDDSPVKNASGPQPDGSLSSAAVGTSGTKDPKVVITKRGKAEAHTTAGTASGPTGSGSPDKAAPA